MALSRKLTVVLIALSASLLSACNGSGVLRSILTLGEATILADSKPINGIDFGAVDCGGAVPESKGFTIRNDGGGPLKWSAELDSTEYFSLAGDHGGTLEAGEEVLLVVLAQKMPSASDAGAVKSASIHVTTDDAARAEIYIPIKATAQGATFELIAPTLADFGSLPLGKAATPIPVAIKNVGNAPATLGIAAPGDTQFTFEWTGGAAADVAPGAALPGLAANFTATTTNTSNSAGILQVEGAVCGASATTIPLKGQGLGGIVGVSPGTVDLGKVGCNTQADAQVVTVYNSGNLVLTWKADFKDGTNFKISPSGGAVPPGGSSQLILTPKKLGMTTNLQDDGFGDTLTITTDIGGDVPHDLPIKQTAAGGILKWTATPLEFGQTSVGVASAAKFVTITNDGNIAIKVGVNGTGQFSGTEGIVPSGGGSFVSSIVYKAANLGPEKGDYVIVTEDPVCAPLPAKVSATGSGKGSAQKIVLNGWGQRGSAQISAQSGCILLANSGGLVACFGNNAFRQLGSIDGTGPTVVPNLKDVVSIAGGGDFNCAADAAGDVYCWGNNRNRNGTRVGKLGVDNVDFTEEPQKVKDVANATQVSAGHNMACALLADTTVKCWGTNRHGNLGSGANGNHLGGTQQVPNLTGVKQLAVGGGGACAIKDDNTVSCWGRYSRGSIGNGNSEGQTSPVQVSGINNAMAISSTTSTARGAARCALGTDGLVRCWGCNRHGQIGDGSSCCGGYFTPVQLPTLSNVTQISGYRIGGCALTGDKTVHCWGRNHFGHIGDGTTFEQTLPSTVTGINDATELAAGGSAACAIVSGGAVKCWGNYGAGSSSTPQNLKYF